MAHRVTNMSPSITWADEALNEEQKDAVKAIVSDTESRVPFLISGPPGTGKTRTIVEAVLQVLRYDASATILVCAPSNPAADILARRLGRALDPSEMFRLNARNRTFAEVPGEVMIYCNVKDDQFDIPPFEQLMKYRVVVCGCLDADILVSARATNLETMRAEAELYLTLHPNGPVTHSEHCIRPHWSHLMIDEVGAARRLRTGIR